MDADIVACLNTCINSCLKVVVKLTIILTWDSGSMGHVRTYYVPEYKVG